VGLDFKPTKYFSATFAPVAGKITLVNRNTSLMPEHLVIKRFLTLQVKLLLQEKEQGWSSVDDSF
jgi:microcystin degradation protein MlrC